MKMVGGMDWLAQAIAGGVLNAVIDGSYIREHYPDLCSTAFILECKCSGGHVVGAFPEASIEANAFHGELRTIGLNGRPYAAISHEHSFS